MATGPNDFRDPKVTTVEKRSSMSWLWWILGIILLLLILAWIFGWFGDDDAETVIVDPAGGDAVATEPAGD